MPRVVLEQMTIGSNGHRFKWLSVFYTIATARVQRAEPFPEGEASNIVEKAKLTPSR
jgi:hypothetical protein